MTTEMATAIKTALVVPQIASRKIATPEASELYPYGWREVCRLMPSGEEKWVRVPLTLEDVLHPQLGDVYMHKIYHQNLCTYLHSALKTQLRNQARAAVWQDVGIKWDVSGLKPHAPDISVIFGVSEKPDTGLFDVAKEGTRPSLVIEVTSLETRQTDVDNKVTEYALARVPYYIIVDRRRRWGKYFFRLLGYQLMGKSYAPMLPNARGQLYLAPVDLWIGIRNNQVKLYDKDGNEIRDHTQETIAREQAEAHAAAESQARYQAEARAQEAEERAKESAVELAHQQQVRVEAEARAKERAVELAHQQQGRVEAEARAKEAEERAKETEARAKELEERLRQLEAALRRQQAES